MRQLIFATLACLLFGPPCLGQDPPLRRLEACLVLAGENRSELEAALAQAPKEQRADLEFLFQHMPPSDLSSLSAEFLLEHLTYAHRAWASSPWQARISRDLFRNEILPYASINERRDAWRRDFHERFSPLIAEAKSPAEAAAILNQKVFPLLGVSYSTKRRKADQSPYESMETGLASCTGLSVLLIDACRSVGVPARFVGTPLWADGSGNHSWVEIWDDGWHFTGAAEPTGDELDRAWFTGRASKAIPADERHGIFAVSFKSTTQRFPLVWRPEADFVHAVDVTGRYVAGDMDWPEGTVRVRFCATDADARLAGQLTVLDAKGKRVFEGQTRGANFDANDHLTGFLIPGCRYEAQWSHAGDSRKVRFQVEKDEQLVNLEAAVIGGQAPGLNRKEAKAVASELWKIHAERIRTERSAEIEARVLEVDGQRMPFWYKAFGKAPSDGRSLWISMHGGGGAPTAVNDEQWENQKGLYKVEEGIYLAPRAPTDTWNLWHQGHIDGLFDRLIEDLIVLENINPDRVYLMGYSAGGDGVYQLAPRMADRFGAAAMMAGHPNETVPDGLRNLAFTLHMGGNDGSYDRNKKAAHWRDLLAGLRGEDPGGYEHWVEIHAGKGHWMDREDAAALPWMAARSRDLRPEKVVWLQDDVTHKRFYWLAVDQPVARSRVVVRREGQEIEILEAQGVQTLVLRLDDSMLDLDKTVRVYQGGEVLYEGRPPRLRTVLAKTLAERGDPKGMFCSELRVQLPGPDEAGD
ncbi:MAG: hypothetical protein OSB57_04555 [Planctomycetota bacterium]|nr:hypothetical protein [Planctomycetota bacterium]